MDEIYGYVAADKPLAAADLIEDLQSAMAKLADLPFVGREGRRTGTRELLSVRPYIIVYTVTTLGVNIDRVFHAAQRR